VPVAGDRCEVLSWGGDPELGWLARWSAAILSWIWPSCRFLGWLGVWRRCGGVGWMQRTSAVEGHRLPVAGLDANGRQPKTAWGEVSPATESFASRLGLVIDSRATRLTPGGASGWAGLSGAAVFCHERLVGVVIEDPQEFAGSLTARRSDCLAEHPLLYAAAGSPVMEACRPSWQTTSSGSAVMLRR
jgi:hypothetical protein